MADEELSVKVAVEGFEDFKRSFKDMEDSLQKTKDKLGELGGSSKQAGTALDSVGDAFDKNTARANKLYLAQTQLTDVQSRLATETNALARAQLTVRADELKKQIEDLSKAEDTGAQSTKKMGLSLTDLKSGIDMALGAMRAFKEAAVKAFEFAQEGAAINATKESFDRLGISIESMREASNNTIPDMALMSSTLTLMAGSSGEVADAFSGAMPQLLAMAKAANKLNPTMGDTSYMLQSITTAAKRQSMQIADNLGIIVKQGDAYKKYADSIGVSVNALTNEQKQVAFLNGLLEAGNVLIEQAGDSTESAADSYAQLTTNVQNLTDELKASTAEAINPAIKALADLLLTQRDLTEATDGHASSVSGMIIPTYEMLDALERQEQAQLALVDAVEQTVPTYQEYIEASFEAIAATNDGTESFGDYDLQMRLASKSALDIAAATAATAQAIMATTDATNIFKAALGGAISNEMAAFRDREGELVAKGEELRAKISELEQKQYLTAAQKEELAELRSQLEENKGAVEENAAKHEEATKRILLGFAEQRLAMDGLTADELMMLQGLAKEWGLLDQATYDAMVAVDEYADSVDNGTGTLDEMREGVQKLTDKLLGIPTEINVNVRVNTTGELPPGMGEVGGESAATREYYQHGGTSSGRSMLVGEGGPEILTGVRGGARVLSAPTTARMMAQNSITNNYNLTTNAMTRPGGLSLEFAAMQMGSR